MKQASRCEGYGSTSKKACLESSNPQILMTLWPNMPLRMKSMCGAHGPIRVGEVGARSRARPGAEFKRAGKSWTNFFMEGCHKPLKPKKYISFMACSAGHFSKAMR